MIFNGQKIFNLQNKQSKSVFTTLISWILALTVAIFVYALFLFALNYPFFDKRYVVHVGMFLFSLVMASGFTPLQLYLQSKTKQLTGALNYTKIMPNLSRHLSACLDKNQLFSFLQTEVLHRLALKHALVIVDQNSSEATRDWEAFTIFPTRKEAVFLSKEDEQSLKHVSSKQLYYEEGNAPPLVLEFLKRYDIALLLPCLSSDGVSSFFCIPKKGHKSGFYQDELSAYQVLASQIAMTLLHIRPYEHIKAAYEKNKIELQKVAQQSAFSSLSMGISHEIRNPMAGILTRTELLEREPENIEEVREYAKRVKRDIFRILNITDIMLRYGSPVTQEKTMISIKDIFSDILFIVKGTCQQNGIQIKTEFLDNSNDVIGDSNRLYQVFNNIVLNAIESMEDSKEKVLSVKTEYHTFQSQGKLVPGVCISIMDTGLGMDKETLGRLFEPFFTTKYKNTGLGMSIVAKVISDHNGLVKVQSEKGKGTCFRIHLEQA